MEVMSATESLSAAEPSRILPQQPPLFLGPHCNGMLLDPWEFDTADGEPGYRYELIRGILIVNPPPLEQERDPNEELGRLLRNFQDSPAGNALDATLSEQTVDVGPHRRQVDRAIWCGLGRKPQRREVPTICVEFVSAGIRNRTRGYLDKRNEYALAGCREYWIIDRFSRQMTAVRYDKGSSAEIVIGAKETYETPLLPGFKLPLAALLARADYWAEG